MGGNAKETTNTTSQTAPWGPATNALGRIVGGVESINPGLTVGENTALSNISNRAQDGNPYASQIGGVANNLLSGGTDRSGIVNDAYSQYQSQVSPTARGDFLDPNTNPFFEQTQTGIANRLMDQLKAEYVGAGRDPTGAGSYAGNVGERVAAGLAPGFMNLYNSERDRQLGAASNLYTAGNTTGGLLSQFDQQRLGNQVQGIGAADAALGAGNYGDLQQLAVEAQRRGIPLQTLAQQMGIVLPIGQAFGTQTGTAEKSNDVPWWQQVLGAATAGAGIYGKIKGA